MNDERAAFSVTGGGSVRKDGAGTLEPAGRGAEYCGAGCGQQQGGSVGAGRYLIGIEADCGAIGAARRPQSL